ncbi:MAG: flagellar protein [Lachnospiraceae bacterium]|nr:flagellar protein [Lachnospiraceae bacterium]
MDVRNCRKCGKLFNYIAGPGICPQCMEKSEEEFQKVKEYLRNNPSATVATTAEACEVEIGQIRQWLREERLTFSSAEGSDLTCEKCGKPIISGRFCEACKNDMAHGLNAAIAKPIAPPPEPKKPTSGGSKMRFL